MMVTTQRRTFRWDVEAFYKLAEAGWFGGKRVELINGEIIEMSPIGSRHWTAVNKTTALFHRLFAERFIISTQNPLRLTRNSEPQPDIALVEGEFGDYKEALPTTAILIVEVSDSTLEYDRRDKANLYAGAGITEYWIINLVDDQIEVRRQPMPAQNQEFGHGYADIQVLAQTDSVTPLAAPHSSIAVADLLP